jgi:uncharacterized protein YgiM (DUF1202 family)
MKEMIKRTMYVFTIGLAIGIIIMHLIDLQRKKKIESIDTLFEVKITTSFINVRTQPTQVAKKVYEVVQNEKYEVVEVFEDGQGIYTWYKIVYQDRRMGWIASHKDEPWVIELR